MLLLCVALLSAPRVSALSINGSSRYESFGYADPDTTGTRWENFFEARLRVSGSPSDTLALSGELRAVADDAGFTAGGYSLRNDTRHRPYLSVITAAASWRPTPDVRFTIGDQISNWSVFDEIQPANFVVPWDESDTFRRAELGVPAVAMHSEHGGAFADLIVVPLAFTPSRLPQGRWRIIPAGVEERQDLPPVRADETQAAARIGLSRRTVEAALFGYVGRNTDAVFVPQLLFVGGIEGFRLRILDRYPRLNAAGANLTMPVWRELLMRVESVYRHSPDSDSADFVHTAVGVEYPWEDWRVVVNYLRDDQTAAPRERVTDEGEMRFFQSFMFGELRYAPEQFEISLRGGYDLAKEFLIAQPKIAYQLWRGLSAALVGDVIWADKPSYFARIQHEDRVGLRVEYAW